MYLPVYKILVSVIALVDPVAKMGMFSPFTIYAKIQLFAENIAIILGI